jgi:hypothetical protein
MLFAGIALAGGTAFFDTSAQAMSTPSARLSAMPPESFM